MQIDPKHYQALQRRVEQLEALVEESALTLVGEAMMPHLTRQEVSLVLDLMPDYVSIITPDADIAYINRSMAGVDRADVIGSSLYDYVDAENHPILDRSLKQALATAEEVNYKLKADINGYSFWMLTRLIPIAVDGTVTKLMAISTDVTEQYELLQKLHLTESRLAELIHTTPLAAMAFDAEYRTIEWNPAAEQLFGWSHEEAIGRPFTELIVPQHEWALRQKDFEQALQTGVIPEYPSYENITRNGDAVTCEWWSSPLKDEAGKVIGIASFAQDVTKKLEAERLMANARDEAEQNARAKSLFLANMSHEIRTPMYGITGIVELLLHRDLPEDIQADVRLINQATHSLLSVVNDVLDFSKIESGVIEAEKVPTDITELIQGVFRLMEPLAEDKGLTFAIDCGLTTHNYLTDPARLRQILNNLINNALKFTASGHVIIRCRLRQEGETADVITVDVEDTGIGISEDKQAVIFSDFYQSDRTITRRYGGTGLGLTISQRLAGLLGGKISVKSSPGFGSTFRLRLQLDKPAPCTAVRYVENDGSPQRNYGRKVLLVDDNPVNLVVGEKLLLQLGVEVIKAENGVLALQVLDQHPDIELIMMDIQMPEMDGIMATRYIRRLPDVRAQLPIIAVTANAVVEEKQRCKEAGMNDFIAKPFSLKQLIGALDVWFQADDYSI